MDGHDRKYRTSVTPIGSHRREHSFIGTTIGSKLSLWVLNKVYIQKKIEVPWSVSKLRDFLSNIVHITSKQECQHLSTFTDTKLTINKLVKKPR